MNTQYDVAILGGGFVGHTLWHVCTQLGLSTLLIDAKPASVIPQQDGRAIALSHGSVTLFQQINVWEKMSSFATPIQSVHVSAQGRLGTMKFDASSMGLDYLGQVVPAPALMNGLMVENISAVVTALTSHPTHISITTDQSTFTASLVLACDGTESFCREHLQFNTQRKTSNKKALVMNVLLNAPLPNRAFQRLISPGVCALLPLPGQKATLVLSLDDARCDEMNALDDCTLSDVFKKIWGGRFGKMQIDGPRFTYPLKEVYATHPVSDRVILLGNASHTLNPIAAQGLNLALRDIAALKDILTDAIALNQDLGAFVPPTFLSRTQPIHERMQQITDFLVNMSYSPLIAPFHGFGLSLMHHMPFVREKCTRMFA